MKLPLKFNKRFLDLYPLSTSSDPIEIFDAQCVNHDNLKNLSSIYVDGVFKSTKLNRFPITSKAILDFYKAQPIVLLDIGTSSGNAICSLLDSLLLKKAYLTDKNLVIKARKIGSIYFVQNTNNTYSMIASKLLVAYFQGRILSYLSKYLFLIFENLSNMGEVISIPLYDKTIENDQKVIFSEFNCFESWTDDKVDLVIAANLLNRSYFSDSQLKKIIKNLLSALVEGGCLAIIDNRNTENSSIYKNHGGKVIKLSEVGVGCSVENLIEGIDFEQ
jgi:hypothetical protein